MTLASTPRQPGLLGGGVHGGALLRVEGEGGKVLHLGVFGESHFSPFS